MFERFTDRARRVLVLAQEESRLLNHNFIGTEHLLLGLIHEQEGVAGQALSSLGITLEAARDLVVEIIGPTGTSYTGSPPFTPRSKKVLELALREALQLGHNYISTEHLLLGLIREGDGVAIQVMVGLGVDLSRLRQRVIELLSGYQTGDPDLVGAQPGAWLGGPQPGVWQSGGDDRDGYRVVEGQGVGAASSPFPGALCGRCGALLAQTARYQILDVAPGQTEARQELLALTLVYCERCGHNLSSQAGPLGAPTVVFHDPSGVVAGRPGEQPPGGGGWTAGSSGPPKRSRNFPADLLTPVQPDDVADSARVELVYRDGELVAGTVAGAEVSLQVGMPSHHGRATGVFAAAGVDVTWDLVTGSSSQNELAAKLNGRFAGETVELEGFFRVQPDLFFDRASITGELGGQALRVAVIAADGGLGSTGTVAADGQVGGTPFELYGAVTGDLTRAVIRGTLDGRPVRLDAISDRTRSTSRITGEYEGPPALLALIVGALVYFT